MSTSSSFNSPEQDAFRAAIEQFPHGFVIYDGQGRFIYINARGEELCGRQSAELIGKYDNEIWPPEITDNYLPYLKRALATGEAQNFEWTLPAQLNGHTLQITYTPIVDAQGTVEQVTALTYDITERKRVEAKALQSEEFARRVLNNLFTFVAVLSPDGTLLEVNQIALAVSGIELEDVVGQKFWDCFWWNYDPQTQALVRESCERAAQGEPSRYDVAVRIAQGQLITIDFMLVPMRDDKGAITHLIPSAVDITDRRRAEEAVRVSEERYRSLFEHNIDGIFSVDLTGHFTDANPAAERISGYTLDELKTLTFADVCAPESLPQAIEAFQTTLQGTIQPLEMSIIRKDGTQVDLLLHGAPMLMDGQITGIFGVAVDVTEQKRAEEALRDREERFRATFEQAAVGIAHVGLDGLWLRVNQRMCDIVGYSREEMSALTFGDITHPDDLDADWEQARRLLNGEISSYEMEKRYIRKDGSMAWVNLTVSLRHNEDGTPRYFIAVVEDIAARKRVEESLRFLAEASASLNASLQYETTLNNLARLCVPALGDGCTIYITDASGHTTQTAIAHREAAQEILMREIQNRFPFDLSTETPYTAPLHQGKSHLENNVRPQLLEEQLQNREYSDLLYKLNLSTTLLVPLMTEGRFGGALVVFRAGAARPYDEHDQAVVEELARRAAVAIERARLFEQAQRAREAAEAANRAKDEFLSVVSHELRTPLTPILGWVDILRRTSEQDIKEHALNVLERNVGAQVQLVNDILDVSRITTGKLRLELQLSDLAMPVAEAIESVLPTATAKGVKLSMVYGQGQARALCDPARVRQVAWNLLSNAIKFTPAGGEVEISLNRAGAHAEIVVRDNGAGIKPDFLPFVFERFRQADSSHTRQHGGLGLGLSIVRHIVETHGGTVRAESQGEGRGATFSVRLPLLPEEAPPEPVEAPETSQPRDALSGVLILVVDDEPDVLELVTFVLEQRGARVRAVDSAASALETLREWRPDIIVCDITMPEMNGHELLTRIRALPGGDLASIPAIVLSANATEPDRRRSLESGFIRHLDKPIRADDLTQAIAETLGL